MINPYENLANAIILQAVADYRKALKQLKQNPDYPEALGTKREVERFFHSQWFQCLTKVDGPALLKTLQKEVAA